VCLATNATQIAVAEYSELTSPSRPKYLCKSYCYLLNLTIITWLIICCNYISLMPWNVELYYNFELWIGTYVEGSGSGLFYCIVPELVGTICFKERASYSVVGLWAELRTRNLQDTKQFTLTAMSTLENEQSAGSVTKRCPVSPPAAATCCLHSPIFFFSAQLETHRPNKSLTRSPSRIMQGFVVTVVSLYISTHTGTDGLLSGCHLLAWWHVDESGCVYSKWGAHCF
jgi:hypothetical protein